MRVTTTRIAPETRSAAASQDVRGATGQKSPELVQRESMMWGPALCTVTVTLTAPETRSAVEAAPDSVKNHAMTKCNDVNVGQ